MTGVGREQQRLQAQRTRRNVVAMAVIAGGAFLSRTGLASARGRGGDHGRGRRGQCFLKGTRIQTLHGERKIEDLAIGDMLPTVFGGMRPIQWIGSYRYRKSDRRKPWAKDVLPVRIARSALSAETPHADLFLTGKHALYIDGVLVPIRNLLNGTTIAVYDAEDLDELEFFHIKLATHDVLRAEGALCETLLRVDENADNFADYYRKYGEPMAEEEPCVAIVSYGGGRSEIKSRLRSAISPWLDRRHHIDAIRDRLEERAHALSLAR